MPLFTTASLSLSSEQEDQFVNVSNDLWQSLVPVNYTQGKARFFFSRRSINLCFEIEYFTVSISIPSLAAPSPIAENKSTLGSFLAHCKPTKHGVYSMNKRKYQFTQACDPVGR
jgi:hypothetical protein